MAEPRPEAAHILVVDDDVDIRQTIRDILELEGYNVATAGNGREALARIAEHRPAVVLLDLQMPVLNGWQTQAVLRAEHPELSVVFMTAEHRAHTEAQQHQAAGYLAKPFDIGDLLDTVGRFATVS